MIKLNTLLNEIQVKKPIRQPQKFSIDELVDIIIQDLEGTEGLEDVIQNLEKNKSEIYNINDILQLYNDGGVIENDDVILKYILLLFVNEKQSTNEIQLGSKDDTYKRQMANKIIGVLNSARFYEYYQHGFDADSKEERLERIISLFEL